MRIALPDECGRAAILRGFAQAAADDVSLDVAEKTPLLLGAELAALCNEAAIRAARRGDQHVTQADFASAMSPTSTRADQASVSTRSWAKCCEVDSELNSTSPGVDV